MSFKWSRFFSLAISFIIGSFFFIVGAFSIILPWSSHLQNAVSQFIFQSPLMLSLFGLGFALIGVSLVIYSILNSKHRYVEIRTGDMSVKIDENVIHQYLENYWQKHFPNTPIPFTFNLQKHSLEIMADLPYMAIEDQKVFLEQVKQDFSELFGHLLGYSYDVRLIAGFQETKENA